MSKKLKNHREPWRKIGKAREYKISIDGENYIHNVPEFKAFDYFSSSRDKESNIPVYQKIADYAKEEKLKVDEDTPPMPLVSAEKYAQLIRKAKEELGQGWGLNEKIYIKNIVDIASSPYTNIRPDKGSNFRKKIQNKKNEESSEKKDSIKSQKTEKEVKHCPRISVQYIINKDKNGCDYVLNSYQNTIYKMSEYLRHDKDTCYVPKISGFIKKKENGDEKEGDNFVSTKFLDGSKQRRFTLNGISGFFIYPLKSEYEIVIEDEYQDAEEEIIESEEESEEESDSDDDGINVKRITLNSEKYLIEDGVKIPRLFRDDDEQYEIGSWWGDGTIRGDQDIEVILDKIKINGEEYFIDTEGILYDTKLKKIGNYSKKTGILTKGDTEIKVDEIINYVVHRDSNTMSTLPSMDSISYLEVMQFGDKKYYLEDDMVYDDKHNYLGLYDKNKNIIESNNGDIIEDFKPKPNTDMKEGLKISGVEIIDKTGELTEADKKHYDEIRKKFSVVKTLETNKWIKRESRKHPGKYYYYNTVTKESTWKKPDNFKGGKKLKKTKNKKKYIKHSNKKISKNNKKSIIKQSRKKKSNRKKTYKNIILKSNYLKGGAIEDDCGCGDDDDEEDIPTCSEDNFDTCEDYVKWLNRDCRVELSDDYCDVEYEEDPSDPEMEFWLHISNYKRLIKLIRELNKQAEYSINGSKIPHQDEEIKTEVEEKLKEAETQAEELIQMNEDERERLSVEELKFMDIWGVNYLIDAENDEEIWAASILDRLISESKIKLSPQEQRQWKGEDKPQDISNKTCNIEAANSAPIGSIPTSIDNCKNCDGTVPLTQDHITEFAPDDLVYLPSKNCETRDSYNELFKNKMKDPFNSMSLPKLSD